jgi:hypothetical protein
MADPTEISDSQESDAELTLDKRSQISDSQKSDAELTLDKRSQISDSQKSDAELALDKRSQISNSQESDAGLTLDKRSQIPDSQEPDVELALDSGAASLESYGIQKTPTRDRRTAFFAKKNNSPVNMRLDEVTDSSSRVGTNVACWNKGIGIDGNGIKLLKVVLPTRMSNCITQSRDLLRAPVVDGREISLVSCELGQANRQPRPWNYMLQDTSKPGQPTIRVYGAFFDTSSLPTKAEATIAGEKLCRFLERLPVPLLEAQCKNRKASKAVGLLQVAVFADLFEGKDWVSGVVHRKFNGFNALQLPTSKDVRFQVRIPVFFNERNEVSYTAQDWRWGFDPLRVNLKVDGPTLSGALVGLLPAGSDADDLRKRKLPDDLLDQYVRAADLLRYVQIKLHGAMGSSHDIEKFAEHLVRPFLRKDYETRSTRLSHMGPYGNKRLVTFSFESAARRFVINLCKAARNDIKGAVPYINIYSASKTRIAFVIQTLFDEYYASGDVLYAWRQACDVADRVCASLISSEDIKMSYCVCSDQERQHKTHICQTCFTEEICIDTSLSDQGNLLCRNCIEKSFESDEFGYESSAKMRRQLAQLINHDKSVAIKDRKATKEEIWSHIQQQYKLPDGRWRDLWTDKARDEDTTVERVGRPRPRPLSLSFDGITPFSILDGKVVYHRNPKNVCTTAFYLNTLKSFEFPIVLGYVRQAVAMRDSPDTTDDDYDKLTDKFDHYYVKKRSYEISHKVRRSQVPAKQVQKLLDEMKQPIASQKEANLEFESDQALHPRYNYKGVEEEKWSSETTASIASILAQAEVRYSGSIPTGSDGAPWIWIPSHMPPNWSWDDLFYVFALRCERFRNKNHKTIDNTVTLLLECALQHLRLGSRDEFLGLPMTMLPRHDLNFSIGHLRHKQQMRTGFTTAYPQDLTTDYDESLVNICFETWLSNHTKWDHAETEYEAMIDDMRSIHVHTDHYDAEIDCPHFNFEEIFSSKKNKKDKRPVVGADLEEGSDESDNEIGSEDESDGGSDRDEDED